MWNYRDRFSQVSTELGNRSDEIVVMTQANVDKHTLNFTETGGFPVIHERGNLDDVDGHEIAESIDGDVVRWSGR